ncbi:phosphotransferase [Tsukamurella sputi]|uniref:Phosphotransferase n=1 Tax=Tsukamurella sputi TaxID=2591848 RepID=A0A5C5RPU3_9ACTN|nr:choline kinase family protein [Tsukamurella sputi]TWS25047.1 phosphotransferase [Tsukamurella sputi]
MKNDIPTPSRTAPSRPPEPDDRAVGTARTDAERAVESVLSGIDAWRGRDLYYAPVTGGLQNSNWRITVSGTDRRFFLKLPGTGSEAFIDRGVTDEAGKRAGALGIGPEIVFFDSATGVEVVEFLEGYSTCTNGDLKRADIPLQIVGLYRTLHASGPLGHRKTVLDMIDEHLTQAAELDVRLPAFTDSLISEYRAARAALLAGGLDIVPCHNDPMPGNFLYHPTRPMKLVDYEFASDNERAYELAVLVTEMFYDDVRVHEMVEEFYGRADFATVARVEVFSALADLKWGLWGCVNQRLTDAWDFDYHKYGAWKLMRSRLKMNDPRWGLWLSTL